MDAIQRGQLTVRQEIRCRDIGGDHALLDELVGVVALHRHDALDLALLAEHDARLRGVEIDCAAPPARLRKLFIQAIQCSQVRPDGFVFFLQLLVAVHQHGRRLRVGEPGMRSHHPLEKAIAVHLPGG